MLTEEQRIARKGKFTVDFTPKTDKDGNVLNSEVLSVTAPDKAKECDINRIVRKVLKPNGEIDTEAVALLRKPGRFLDLTKAGDFQDAQERQMLLRRIFDALAPEERFRFGNDPIKMLEYLETADNDDLIARGYKKAPKVRHEKLETPEGNFWVKTVDGVEVERKPITAPAAPPA